MKLQIVIDGQAYEVDVDLADEDPPRQLPGTATIHSMVVPTAASSTAFTDSGVDEHKVCRSPVNGIVVAVVAKVGDPVEAGDLIVLLEAMKMETKVTAPCEATVKSILVAPGEAVKLNQILAEFE